MIKFFIKVICFTLICGSFLNTRNLKALIPYYYLPSSENFKKNSISIGKSAYQLLYFGQIKDSLNLAKLAIKINRQDEKLWSILAEAQIANELYKDALFSLNEAQKLNPKLSEFYFAKSSIYLKELRIKRQK